MTNKLNNLYDNYSFMNNEKNIKNEKLYLLLDSSLISATFNKKIKRKNYFEEHKEELQRTLDDKPIIYDYKIVKCGSYVQVYYYKNSRIKNPKKDDDADLNLQMSKYEVDISKKETKLKTINEIEERNIIRSKLQCQRIAKANMEYWETFITLTFEDNVTDIKLANKRFKYFIDKVRRIKNDLRYLVVPEHQKRGAIHYHLLTNISINDTKLMYNQENNPKFKHVKYWLDGFNSVEHIKFDVKKIVGYISKYMTKDIDNRLFGQRRFFCSQNCIVPKVSYIDSMDSRDLEFLQEKIQDLELIYQNEYLNTYDDSKVSFLEYSTPQEHFTTK